MYLPPPSPDKKKRENQNTAQATRQKHAGGPVATACFEASFTAARSDPPLERDVSQ